MVKVFINGMMEENIRDSINTIRSMAMESILGLTEGNMMAAGQTDFVMEEGNIF
jgi:hypothetical protein